MLTPKELLEIEDTMRPILDELNAFISEDMIKRAMARLGRGEGLLLTGTDQWQAQLFQEAGGHLETLQAKMQSFTKASDKEIKAIFEDAGIRAWARDEAFYIAAGLEAMPLMQSERILQILEDTYRRTNNEVHNFTRTTATASQDKFIKAVDSAHFKVLTGAQSYTSAVKDAINELCSTQLEVVYPTKHRDSIETAVLRAVRTGVAQASGNMTMQGMIDRDWDIIRVSAHLGARVGDGGQNPGNHSWWQGMAFSRTGRTPGLLLFGEATGYGTGEGLSGYNCRHSFGPGDLEHNPFENYDSAENEKAYKLSQKQRGYEAKIRESKLKVLGLQTALEYCEDEGLKATLQQEYEKASLLLRQRNKRYNDFCEQNDLPKLNDRITVARWNRSTAAKANAAANRAQKQQNS